MTKQHTPADDGKLQATSHAACPNRRHRPLLAAFLFFCLRAQQTRAAQITGTHSIDLHRCFAVSLSQFVFTFSHLVHRHFLSTFSCFEFESSSQQSNPSQASEGGVRSHRSQSAQMYRACSLVFEKKKKRSHEIFENDMLFFKQQNHRWRQRGDARMMQQAYKREREREKNKQCMRAGNENNVKIIGGTQRGRGCFMPLTTAPSRPCRIVVSCSPPPLPPPPALAVVV